MSTCVPSTSPTTQIGLSCTGVFDAFRSATNCEMPPENLNSCDLSARSSRIVIASPWFRYESSRNRWVRISKLNSVPLKISGSGLKVTLVPVLSETPIAFRFCDQVCDYAWRAPVLGLDHQGTVREIRFNPWLTEPLEVAPDRFRALYGALRRFDELSQDPRLQVRIRLDAGTMSAFDNRRILHGRAAFDDSGARRHFQGCYVEREEVMNRIRVLERSL